MTGFSNSLRIIEKSKLFRLDFHFSSFFEWITNKMINRNCSFCPIRLKKGHQFRLLTPFVNREIFQDTPDRSSNDQTNPAHSEIGCSRKPIGIQPMPQPGSQVHSQLSRNLFSKSRFASR
jgi:hypothetical protein